MRKKLRFGLGSLTVFLLALIPSVVPVGGSIAPSYGATVGDASGDSAGVCLQTVSSASGVTVTKVANDCLVEFTSGTNNWTIPSGVASFRVLAVGGGGGGGGDAGGGGGGGGLYDGVVTLSNSSVASSATISVGDGGYPGVHTVVSGLGAPFDQTRPTPQPGGNSSFSVTDTSSATISVTAFGGSGGGYGASGSTAQGGLGGSSSVSDASALISESGAVRSGARGGNGVAFSGFASGSDGSSGNTLPTFPSGGSVLASYGGGGGGGASISTDAHVGGAGGSGGGGSGGGGSLALTTAGSTDGGRTYSSVPVNGTYARTFAVPGSTNSGGGGGSGSAQMAVDEYSIDGELNRSRNGGSGGSGVVAVRYSLPTALTINTQPSAQSVVASKTASFSVSASGSTLSYQWESSSDGSSYSPISGATGASYTTGSLARADNGKYFRVKITNTNADGNFTETYSSAATLSVSAAPDVDYALDFDGTNDYAQATAPAVSSTHFTVEAWVYDTESSSGYNGILRLGTNNSQRVFIQTQKASISNEIQIGINGTSSWRNTGIDLPQNQWAHIALTRTNSAWVLYLNGAPVGSGVIAAGAFDSGPLRLGTSEVSSASFWKGKIDQVKVWDYPLSEAQVALSMHAHGSAGITGGGSAPDLISHHDFNVPSASTVADDIGSSDLSLNGSMATSDFEDVKSESVVSGYKSITFPRSYLTAEGGWLVPSSVSTVDYLVVAGGGGGGGGNASTHGGGGGGAGGLKTATAAVDGFVAVTVGTGGLGGIVAYPGGTGKSSSLGAISASGGGGGGSYSNGGPGAGGSGGGAGAGGTGVAPGGTARSGAGGTAGQGYAGGGTSGTYRTNYNLNAGGGGGASSVGSAGVTLSSPYGGGGAGGAGTVSAMTGASVVYAGGGGGGGYASGGTGGLGGGGTGGSRTSGTGIPADANTGGGGGGGMGTGGSSARPGGAGANGIVVVRYQLFAVPTVSGPGNQTVVSGTGASFTVSGTNVTSYQWQVSTDGGLTWAAVAGQTSATLTVASTTTSMNANQYRAVLTNTSGSESASVTSSAGILTVEDGATVTGAFCDGSYTKNGLTVDAGHGTVFYIDTGQGQEIDAGYIAYMVESANARNDLWVEVTDFTGGVVSLANVDASTLPLGAITAGGSDTAFFMIKASGATATAQSHIVNIYSQKPTIGAPRPIYSCGYTFVEVAETIKAAANKVQSVTSTTASRIGSTMTITVQGDTGTIGQGNDIDGRMIWVTPAARSDWPTDALRLESTSITFYSNSNRSSVISTHPDTLRVNATTTPALSGTNRQYYTATYTFRVIGSAANVAPIIPIAMISSGTQVKHTDVGGLPTGGTTSVDLRTPSIDLTVSKAVSSTTVVNSDGTTTMSYTIRLVNGGPDPLIIDEVVDTPDSNLMLKPGTAKFNGSTISDPGATGAASLAFSGPMNLPANSTRLITYDMTVATCAVGSTYSFNNTAVAKTGSVVIGSGSATQSAVNIAGNCGVPQAVVTVTDVPVDPAVTTSGASAVTTTTATISGTLDPNSQPGLDVQFRYSTNADMSSSTAVTLLDTTFSASPYGVNTNLSGLSPGTTYYYVLEVEDPDASPSGWISGTVKSFTTDPAPAPVSATTASASSITITSAVLNGSVDANGISGGAKVKFEWATDNSAGSCSSRGSSQLTGFMQSENGAGGTEDSLLTGTSAVPMSYSLSGLSANTAYCYQILAFDGVGFTSQTTGGWVAFTSTAKTAQTISWSTSANPLAAGGTTTVAAVATSGLAVVYTSADTSICTVDPSTGVVSAVATSGTCSITATQAGDATRYAAIPVTTTFAILPPVVTPGTLSSGTYQSSGYNQTLGATGGNGTYGTWAVSAGALPAGLSLNASTGVISGTPSAAGVFTFSVTVVSNGVTSAPQSFTITIAKRTVTVTASSPSVVYGAAAPTVTPTYSGFQGSDQTTVASSGNVAPICTSAYVVGQNVGATAATSCSGAINANYTFTYATGNVSVTKFPVTVTAIDAAKQNIVSGSNTEVTADPTLRWSATSPLPAGQTMTNVIPSGVTITRASSGTAPATFVTSGLPSGEVPGTFTITPSGTPGLNYDVTYVNGTFTIQTPKQVPSLAVSNKSMTYGDSTTASSLIGGTASNRASGSVAGTVVYKYVDGDGTTQTLTSLSGLEAGTYLILVEFTPSDITTYYHDGTAPLTETMVLSVQRKVVTVTAADKKKLIGALDPSLTWAGAGYLGSDTDANLGPVTISRASGETEGSYVITTTGGDTPNYAVTHVSGLFYIFQPVITVTETAGVLTNRTVQADCRGLKPGASADFILITGGSAQTIATTVVASNGTCPMSSTLDSATPQGVHSLKITSTDPLNGAVVKLRNVILLASSIQLPRNNAGGARPGFSGGGAPPLVVTPVSLVTGFPGVRRVTIVPALLETPPSATPIAQTGQLGTQAPRVPSLPGATSSSVSDVPGGATATRDFGSGVVSGDELRDASNEGAGTSAQGLRSVQELASERLGGFEPGVSTRIEILGARSAARFVVTEAEQIDTFTVIRAIQASVPAQAADFFALDDVRPATAPRVLPAWEAQEREGIAEFFEAAGLAQPVSLADLDVSGFSQWVQVTGSAATYAPGSFVYLTLTSEPLVLASAQVDQDGTVVITGSLPVEWLTAGEHRVRLVGIRSLDGVSVDEDGEVQLSDQLMTEIQRFDLGTQATIAVMGSNLTGGDHVALRVVPLVPLAPWWTLWFILAGFLVVLVARWRRVLKTRGRHLTGTLIVLASATPGVIVGWLSTVTGVVWWALGLGILASVLSWFAPQKSKPRRAED